MLEHWRILGRTAFDGELETRDVVRVEQWEELYQEDAWRIFEADQDNAKYRAEARVAWYQAFMERAIAHGMASAPLENVMTATEVAEVTGRSPRTIQQACQLASPVWWCRQSGSTWLLDARYVHVRWLMPPTSGSCAQLGRIKLGV